MKQAVLDYMVPVAALTGLTMSARTHDENVSKSFFKNQNRDGKFSSREREFLELESFRGRT